MAIIVNITQTPAATTGFTYTATLGPHATGDLLLVLLSNDGGGTTISTASSGWALIPGQAAAGGCRAVWAWKIAESAAEADPTFSGSSAYWIATCLVIRGITATPFGSIVSGTDYVRTDFNNVATAASGSLTTEADECLLLYSWTSDGTLVHMLCAPEEANCVDKYAASQINHIIGCNQQQTAGAVPSVTMRSRIATEGGNGWVLAVRSAEAAALQPMARPSTSMIAYYGQMGSTQDSITWEAPSSLTAAINGINCSSVAPTVGAATIFSGGTGVYLRSAESTAGAWVGGCHSITATDMSEALLSVLWATTVVSGSATGGEGGHVVVFSDGTNWAACQVTSPGVGWKANTIYQFFIQPGSATPYASSGTVDFSAITKIGLFSHRIGSTTSGVDASWKHAMLYSGPVAITGGGSNKNITLDDVRNALDDWVPGSEHIRRQGVSQFLTKIPLQYGDGVNRTHHSSAGTAIEFPKGWSAIAVDGWQQEWNVGDGAAGIFVKGSALDVLEIQRSVQVTDTTQPFELDAASSTSAQYSFAGAPIVGFDVVWKTGIPCNAGVFDRCTEIDGKAAAFNTCTISGSTGTHAMALDAGGSVTNSAFTKGSDTYALNLRTAGAYNLSGCTFSGYTNPLHITATTGTVTLTLADDDDAPSYVSDGATVVIAPKSVPISISGVVPGSTLAIYRNSDQSEIVAPTVIDGTGEYSTSYTYTVAVPVTVTVRKATTATKYLPYSAQGIISGSGLSMIVSQIVSPVLN